MTAACHATALPAGPVPVLGTQSPADFRAALERAAALLAAGEIVAVPTETVYGLAANARNAAAVAKLFVAKGRPAHNPIIVHVSGLGMARDCVAEWPDAAERLARAFWPGPLTVVLPKRATIPDVVTAGGPTVGIRWPSHPFMRALIERCGFPLAAPSANPANRLSPTTAAHVIAGLGGGVPLVVDGGTCQVGLESTVVDLTRHPPKVLRPGMIHEGAIEAVLGELGRRTSGPAEPVLRSPGQLPRHYAPRARLLVLSWGDTAGLQAQLGGLGERSTHTFVVAHTHIPAAAGFAGVSVIPHDPEAFARAFYAELHRGDASGARCLVVEAVPDTPCWAAIADRLRRAAT